MASTYNGVKIMADVRITDKYVVIGGQYSLVYYGCTPTLMGAKRLAGKNREYWDNWQGWHTPNVYNIEDVEFTTVDEYEPNDMYSCYARPREGAVPLYGDMIPKTYRGHKCKNQVSSLS